jgi:signal transduction histidine kinase
VTRLIPDTLAGRTIAVLLLSLGLFHLFSIYVYQVGLESATGSAREHQLAERLASIKRVIADRPAMEREQTAHSLTTASIEVHWSLQNLVNAEAVTSEHLRDLRSRLMQLLPELNEGQIRLGYADERIGSAASTSSTHVLLASLQLADGSWVNFGVAAFLPGAASEHGVFYSTTAMAVGIVLVSVFLVRTITAPLRALAHAAERTGVDVAAPGVPETGPAEVRHAAHAFNQMQTRLRRLIEDRAQTLAAISHDLKTPITRLRLRAEFVGDESLRKEIDDDLTEMEAMIESTLAFLRGEIETEETRSVDLSAILETICGDLADSGHNVEIVSAPHALLPCRSLAIKRALSNLIQNAVKYGGNARVLLALAQGEIQITIDDDGPGIPDDQIEAVFNPFHRMEESRSRVTGGSGLGLTVARSLIRAHGGEVALRNRPEGGLQAIVNLPRVSQASARETSPPIVA